MDRKQRAEIVAPAAAKKGVHLCRIEIKCVRIDIGKDRARAGAHDRAGGREETERCGENLISSPHSCSVESQPQSVSTRGAADSVRRTAEVGEFPLERLDLRSQNVMLRSAYPSHRLQHFGSHLLI